MATKAKKTARTARGARAADKQRQNSGKRANKTSFKPGNPHAFKPGDPRINRNGRPRSHDELRALIQDLAAEPDPAGGLTRIEAMLLGMFTSSQPADRANLLEHGWGKVPQAHKIGGDQDNPILVAADLAQAEQELNAWRKKMTEQLSGLNVVPIPDTSSTPTA